MKMDNPYAEKYAGPAHYWGKRPSVMCRRVVELMGGERRRPVKLLDLGCGDGRNEEKTN